MSSLGCLVIVLMIINYAYNQNCSVYDMQKKLYRKVECARQAILDTVEIQEERCVFTCISTPSCVGFVYNKTEATCTLHGGDIDWKLKPRSIWLLPYLVSPAHRVCNHALCLHGAVCAADGCTCECQPGFAGDQCDKRPDCSLINSTPGVYNLQLPRSAPFQAFCDDGWTTILHRVDGSEDFNRKWDEYKAGFGDPNGEYWLGNEMMHQITSQGNYKLKAEMTIWATGTYQWAEYDTFAVGSEGDKYKLRISGYTGNLTTKAFIYHNGAHFSTNDRDHDTSIDGSCAQSYKGGFWFKKCTWCNPTGIYKASYTWAVNCVGWYYNCLSALTFKIKQKT